jgi:hypothetical protein
MGQRWTLSVTEAKEARPVPPLQGLWDAQAAAAWDVNSPNKMEVLIRKGDLIYGRQHLFFTKRLVRRGQFYVYG